MAAYPSAQSRKLLLWLPLTLVALGLSGALGWRLGQDQNKGKSSETPQTLKQQQLERRANALETKLIAGNASESEELQLLRLRLASGDRDGAIALLEPLSNRYPQQWSLRLLLADLRQQQNDSAGAEREINHVLQRNPLQIDALRDYTRLQLSVGNPAAVNEQLQRSSAAAKGRPEALPIGLLQADLQQRNGDKAAAEGTYTNLIAAHPTDPRPLLALALLKQSQGDLAMARQLLLRAKLHSSAAASRVLDQVAASWSVAQVREQAPSADAASLQKPAAKEEEEVSSGADGNELGGG